MKSDTSPFVFRTDFVGYKIRTGGRARTEYRRTKTLTVVRLPFPVAMHGLSAVDAEVQIKVRDLNEGNDKVLEWTQKPSYKVDTDQQGRKRLRVKFGGKMYCLARLVAFAAKNTPGITFEEYCSRRRRDSGSRDLYWEADHTNQDPSTILWSALEVKSHADNRTAAILHRQQKAKAAKAKPKLSKRRKR